MKPTGKTLIDQLEPIEVRRKDPTSGKEFIFRSAPPISLITNNRYSELTSEEGFTTKGFAEFFLWEVLAGRWDLETYKDSIKAEAIHVLPLLKEVITDIKVTTENPGKWIDGGNIFRYTLSFNPETTSLTANSTVELLSAEFLSSLVKEVFESWVLELAMAWYSTVLEKRIDNKSGEATHDKEEPTEPEGKSKSRLYPNSKELNLSKQFAMPHVISTNLSRAIQRVNRAGAIKQFEDMNRDRHSSKPAKTTFKTRGRDDETEFILDPAKVAIKTAEQFADRLMRLKDAKVLQSFFGVIKWANLNDTSVFKNVPISEVMGLVLKSKQVVNFTTKQRREFSETLEYLASLSITVSVVGERVNKKTGKGKPVLKEYRDLKLIHINPEYSVRKEFQSIPREALRDDIHFDKTVITRFSGELLPGYSDVFTERANIYFDSLLQFDAGRDATAIVFGFYLQTRFNQLGKSFSEKLERDRYVEVDRAFLINLCEYQKTNQTKPSQATKQLANTLDKLKSSGIIVKYEGLTNNDEDKVRIYSPDLPEPKALG